jgi:hypothetical protein
MEYSRLKGYIKASGHSIKHVAEQIGLTEAGLHAAIQNNTLKVRDLEAIAAYCNFNPCQVFTTTDTDTDIKTLISQISEQIKELKTIIQPRRTK